MEMRPSSLILLSSAVSAAVGAVIALALAPEAKIEPRAALPDAAGSIAEQLVRVETRQDELDRTLADLRDAQYSGATSRSADVDVDAAIERWMAAHASELSIPSEVAVAESPAARAERVTEALAQLAGDDLDEIEAQQLWRKFAEEGLADDILAEIERQAELDPDDADLKVDLANLYFLKLTEVGDSPEAGMWATKADKLLDAALEIDPNHWEARFSKAIALSFWPPVFGKQKEAILHFETLVAQQANQPKHDDFAQTHLLLGNMYLQVGEPEKAVAAWQVGLAQFPGDEDLQNQVDLYVAD